MQDKIEVGMGEFKITSNPTILQTMGLGSCVAVCLYDRGHKIGGLAHILLPDSKSGKGGVNPMRFADRAIDAMLERMERKGCENITAKIFGGASMFANVNKMMQIGERNIEAVRKVLGELKIRIIADDTGGSQGRSVWFDTTDGSVVVSHTHGETVQM